MNKPKDLVVQLKALIGDEKDGFTYEFVDDSGETFLEKDIFEKFDARPQGSIKINYNKGNVSESTIINAGLDPKQDFKKYLGTEFGGFQNLEDGGLEYTQLEINKNSKNILNFLKNTVYGDKKWIENKRKRTDQYVSDLKDEIFKVQTNYDPKKVKTELAEKAGYNVDNVEFIGPTGEENPNFGNYVKAKNAQDNLFKPYTVEFGKESKIFFDDSNFEQKGYQGQTFIGVDRSVDLQP